MGEIFQTLISHGHDFNKLKYEYTIDQVYLFYEKCKKRELDQQKLDAITLVNSVSYANPSHDQASARRKQQDWKRFINSLEWEDKPEKRQTVGDVKKMFSGLGIPIPMIKNKKKEDEN